MHAGTLHKRTRARTHKHKPPAAKRMNSMMVTPTKTPQKKKKNRETKSIQVDRQADTLEK